MKNARKKLRLILWGVTAVYLACSIGCDGRSVGRQSQSNFQQQYERDYQKQKDVLEMQNAEWERQNKKIGIQDARYEAILTKWKEHCERTDALLVRWDRILGVLEKRSGDG